MRKSNISLDFSNLKMDETIIFPFQEIFNILILWEMIEQPIGTELMQTAAGEILKLITNARIISCSNF